MPAAVRALVAVLLIANLALAVNILAPVIGTGTTYQVVYNGALVGAALLCLARAAHRPSERVAWALMGSRSRSGPAATSTGRWSWRIVAEAPYPSLADARLARLPARSPTWRSCCWSASACRTWTRGSGSTA